MPKNAQMQVRLRNLEITMYVGQSEEMTLIREWHSHKISISEQTNSTKSTITGWPVSYFYFNYCLQVLRSSIYSSLSSATDA